MKPAGPSSRYAASSCSSAPAPPGSATAAALPRLTSVLHRSGHRAAKRSPTSTAPGIAHPVDRSARSRVCPAPSGGLGAIVERVPPTGIPAGTMARSGDDHEAALVGQLVHDAAPRARCRRRGCATAPRSARPEDTYGEWPDPRLHGTTLADRGLRVWGQRTGRAPLRSTERSMVWVTSSIPSSDALVKEGRHRRSDSLATSGPQQPGPTASGPSTTRGTGSPRSGRLDRCRSEGVPPAPDPAPPAIATRPNHAGYRRVTRTAPPKHANDSPKKVSIPMLQMPKSSLLTASRSAVPGPHPLLSR